MLDHTDEVFVDKQERKKIREESAKDSHECILGGSLTFFLIFILVFGCIAGAIKVFF